MPLLRVDVRCPRTYNNDGGKSIATLKTKPLDNCDLQLLFGPSRMYCLCWQIQVKGKKFDPLDYCPKPWTLLCRLRFAPCKFVQLRMSRKRILKSPEGYIWQQLKHFTTILSAIRLRSYNVSS
eukprot:scaffold909_cov135-Cylindrotheca_fusiformis.AAC.27